MRKDKATRFSVTNVCSLARYDRLFSLTIETFRLRKAMSAKSVVLLVILVTIYVDLSSAFEWRKDPGTVITQTYPKQKTLVLRWEWRLSGGEVFSQARITRYKAKDKDNTDTYIGTLYSSGRLFTDNKYFNMSGQKGTDGGIDGYIEFTINDTNNQGYNGAPDSSKVDVLVSDYTYECDVTIETVQNPNIKITKLIVYVLPGKPVLQLHPDKPVFCQGDTINITCNGITGHPTLTNLAFLQNNSSIGMLNVTTSGNYIKAVLSNALTQPGALTFSCKATNDGGSSPTSNVVTITVKDPPVITSCTNKTAVEKGNLVWSCDVNGSQPLNISWFKGNTSTVFQSGKSLNNAAVKRNDRGMYRFTASNGGECPTASTTVYLDVQYKPRNVQVVPSSVPALDINGSFSLTCNASSNLDGIYTWSKNGVTLVGKTNRVLTKDNITPQDAGEYTCTVTNSVGSSTSNKVTINVNYSPTCIYNTFEATNRQCVSMQRDGNPLSTLSCSPPEDINISQIGNNYTMCGVKSNSISICTMANAIGKCSFILKVYEQATEYLYKGSFRITSRLYQDSLNDRSSVQFKTLKANIENMLKSVYTSYKYVTSAEVMEFWPGSVVVAFQLKLVANIKDPLLPMKEALIKNGSSLGGFKIDPNSIQSGEYIPPTTIRTTKATTLQSSPASQSSPMPCICTESSQVPAIVLGVLFAIGLVFNIILVGYIIWKHRIENKARSKSSANNNQEAVYMNDIALQDQVSSNVAQYESVNNQEQQQPTTQLYQSLQTQTPSDTYSSLSPNTKLPPKPEVITNSGVYQDIQGASRPQYQSLDNFSRV